MQVKFVYEGYWVKVKVTGYYHTIYKDGLTKQVARQGDKECGRRWCNLGCTCESRVRAVCLRLAGNHVKI